MKTLILLLAALLFVGCASTETDTPPPAPDGDDLHAIVLQTDKDWASYVSITQVPAKDAMAVVKARNDYDVAVRSGDAERIQETGHNYISMVNELMMPPLAAPPKAK